MHMYFLSFFSFLSFNLLSLSLPHSDVLFTISDASMFCPIPCITKTRWPIGGDVLVGRHASLYSLINLVAPYC